MTERIPEAVSWCLTAGLLAVGVLLTRQRGISGRQRRRADDLSRDLRARDEALRLLAEFRLPAPEDTPHRHLDEGAGHTGRPAVRPPDARLAGTDFAKQLDLVAERFSEAVGHARARADRSAKSALRASMRSIQALADEQRAAIAGMRDGYDHPGIRRDLLEIDHTNAQFGRRAEAIAVLCGSWPGRRRGTSALTEVVRGAASRVRDYRRVRVDGEADVAVEGRAVEPVVLAVAELLDNAARHSRPGTTVEVTVLTERDGARVVVDDAGSGMDDGAIERAAGLLTGGDPVDVTRLGDPPRFGFAVVGVLAARYGFSVAVDERSPQGGVRAVLFLPAALLTRPVPAVEAPPRAVLAPTAGRAGSVPSPLPTRRSAAPVGTTTVGGLPKRRRRAPQRPAPPDRTTAAPERPAAPAPERAAQPDPTAAAPESPTSPERTAAVPERPAPSQRAEAETERPAPSERTAAEPERQALPERAAGAPDDTPAVGGVPPDAGARP
ncbi:ATP-binding protein [Streptomyces sp. NPDC127038]|uniref:ATP-binding protein n=1 Tax=Streptomyces sp. NPDC127038 TaxID=3347114 RepID=UPI003669A49F